MLDIIICEDNGMERSKIESIIKEEIVNLINGTNIALSTDNPKDVINYLKKNLGKCFIYFLDVELVNELNGIELAKVIRNYDSKGYIVFITSHAEFSLLTFKYKVQAFDYILKSDNKGLQSSILDCLNEAYKDYKSIDILEKEKISINLGNRIEKFPFEEIMFFETTKVNHKLCIHTIKGHFEFYGKMKDLEDELPSFFYKAHRSYLVNTTKIKSFDKTNKTIYMVNDEACYASLLYLKGLIKNV